jgi:outer membrane immunogenic protein
MLSRAFFSKLPRAARSTAKPARQRQLITAAVVTASLSCATVTFASSVFSPEWTGLYLGGSIGARRDVIDWSALNAATVSGANAQASASSQAARLGVFSGINFQFGSFVIGAEGDIAWGKNSGLGINRLVGYPSASGDQMTIDTNVDGSLRLRAGVLLLPTLLVYGTGGLAYQHLDVTAKCTAAGPWCVATRAEQISSNRTGLTLGGGVETLLLNKFTARLEYRWTGYGGQDVSFFSNSSVDALKAHLDQTSHIVSLGVAYKF